MGGRRRRRATSDTWPRCGPRRSPGGWPAVGDTAIQVFGGIGYTWEHDAHLYLKRLLSWSAFLGGPDRYLVEVGAQFAESVSR